MILRLKTKGEGITILQVYAPTVEKDNDKVEVFYAVLQEVISRSQRGDKVVMMGDFNVREWEAMC